MFLPPGAGLNGMNSSIWEHFASGSFSPGTSPAFLSGPGAAELARLRQELDEANGTIKQWEESWKQAKQVPGPTPTCSTQCLVASSPSYTAGFGWGKQGLKNRTKLLALPQHGRTGLASQNVMVAGTAGLGLHLGIVFQVAPGPPAFLCF